MSNVNVSSKTCFKCGISKPRAEFYKHPYMGDGLLGKCKECTKKDVSEHRLKNIDRIREYDKKRASIPHRRKMAIEISRIWRSADKRRAKCHRAVSNAVRLGKIERKPCCVCGAVKSIAHHESYDKPLDVVWYCQVHHKERHKQMAIEGIDP